ncbi:LamG domain-containing protein, partial [bacterium]|nr:LamG domain-containing protein [bacterium]
MSRLSAVLIALALAANAAEPAGAAEATTILLLESDHPHCSTTFKDASPRAHKVERAGQTHHSSAQKKLGRSSIRFDGRGDYLTVADHPAFHLGVDDFAVEFWFLPQGAGRRFICGQVPADGANVRSSICVAIEADGRLRAFAQSAWKTYLLTAPPESYHDGKWHHVSFRRDGDHLRLLVDGKEHARERIGPEPVN